MQVDRFSLGLRTALTMLALVLFATSTWAADHEKVLHSFYSAGYNPTGNLIMDAAGNLFGEASRGGIYDRGIVFELSPRERGGWTEQVLHSFGNGTDGAYPTASLITDTAGNLYGTTTWGGIHCDPYGCGTVFELSPREDGGWTERLLHSFGEGNDGIGPAAGLIFDAAGKLYGTTSGGGIHSYCDEGTCGGTAFELSPNGSGGWTEQVLHSFGEEDGSNPASSLIFDSAGNLYGTTPYGGIHPACGTDTACGTAFELMPREGGGWTEKTLHSFGGFNDGTTPFDALIMDGAGNLYGTTGLGGIYGSGTVFEITPSEVSGIHVQD